MQGAISPEDDRTQFPLAPATWKHVSDELRLSPQQKRIVELLLCGKKCKDIGPSLGLATPTVRTYLKRIYERHGINDRADLLLLIMALAQESVEKTKPSQRRRSP